MSELAEPWPVKSPPVNETSLRKSAARGSAITLLAQGLRIILQLASVVLLARLINPSDFGLFAMVFSIASVANIFLDFGFSMAALRAKDLDAQQHSNLFWINTAAGAILSIIVFLMAHPIAYFFAEPRLTVITQWLSIIYFLGGLTAQLRVSLNRTMRFSALALADIASPLIALIIAFILATQGYGVASLVAQQIAASAAMLIITFGMARWIPCLPRKTAGMKPLLSFGAGFAATRVLSYLTQNVDSIAIGRVWGPFPLGLYDRAYQVSVSPVSQISFPMSRIVIPILTRVSDDSKRFLATLREAQLIGTYATSSLLLVLSGVAAPTVSVVFGESWIEAAPILSILCISALFRTVQQPANWVLIVKGLAGPLLKFNLVAQPVVVIFVLAGIFWGPIGVASGSAIGYAFYWIASIAWTGRITDLNLWPLFFRPLQVILTFSLPAGTVAYAVVYFFTASPIIELIAGLIGAFIWFVFMFFISRTIRADITSLLKFALLAVARR